MIRATPAVDRLDRDGRTLLLYERSVVELNPLGAAAFDAAADGIALDDLTTRLVEAFGSPPESPAADLVTALVTVLVERGVLSRDDDAEPGRD